MASCSASVRAAALVTVLASLSALSCGPDSPRRPRHVVVVVVDTLRADRCSVHGYDRPTTPALDRLAPESVVYDDCWAPAPWTGPSHASLFTGLRPEEHGFLRSLNTYLPEGPTTLAEELSAAGFETTCFSTNPNVGPARRLDRGFGRFEPCFRYLTSTAVGSAGAVMEHVVVYEPATSAAERAMRSVLAAEAKGRRAFTFLNLLDPHLSYDPPPAATAALVRPTDADLEAWARRLQFPVCAEPALGVGHFSAAQWAVLSDLYDAEVRSADDALDVLIGGLRDAGLLDSTLLVVTSDHGEMLGQDGFADHAFHMRPELLRIPLLIRWPDAHAAGEHVSDLVRLEDVAPTILEACGLAVPQAMSGRSLLASTAERVSFAATDPPTEALAILADRYPGYPLDTVSRSFRSVADGRWHYLRDDLGTEWLWDLVADPGATRNIIGEQPGEAVRLHALLREVYAGW